MSQMTRRSVLFGAIGVGLHAASFSRAGDAESKTIDWQSSLQGAHKLATQQNKPLLIIFGAEWCGPCKKLEKTTLSNPQLAKYINSTFVSVHLDVDKEEKVAKILEVTNIPCTIILSPNADLLGRLEGFVKPAPMYEKLAAAHKLHTEIQQAAGQAR